MAGARRRRALREDGAQRHRVRRHPVARRGVPRDARRAGDEPRRHGRGARGLEPRPPRLLPGRDRRLGDAPPCRRPAAARGDPRCRRAEGDGPLDRRGGARGGHPRHHGRRGGIRRAISALVDDQGTGVEGARRTARGHRRRPFRRPVRSGGGALRLQDRVVRPGVHASRGWGRGARVGSRPRRDRHAVARGLHHPRRLPGEDPRRLPIGSGHDEHAPRPLLRRSPRRRPGRLASHRRQRGDGRHPGSGLLIGPRVLSTRTAAPGCPPTSSRRCATTSGRTPTNGSTGPGASSSTPTGPAMAVVPSRPRPAPESPGGESPRRGRYPWAPC